MGQQAQLGAVLGARAARVVVGAARRDPEADTRLVGEGVQAEHRQRRVAGRAVGGELGVAAQRAHRDGQRAAQLGARQRDPERHQRLLGVEARAPLGALADDLGVPGGAVGAGRPRAGRRRHAQPVGAGLLEQDRGHGEDVGRPPGEPRPPALVVEGLG